MFAINEIFYRQQKNLKLAETESAQIERLQYLGNGGEGR